MILHSLWAARPVGGGMQHINLGWFCQLGIALNDIANGDGLKSWQVSVQSLPKARQMLIYMGDERLLAFSLYASRPLVWQAIEQIDRYLAQDEVDQKAEFAKFKPYMTGLFNKLLVQLDGDLSSQPIFLVEPKRSHDIRILLNDGTKMFSDYIKDGATVTDFQFQTGRTVVHFNFLKVSLTYRRIRRQTATYRRREPVALAFLGR